MSIKGLLFGLTLCLLFGLLVTIPADDPPVLYRLAWSGLIGASIFILILKLPGYVKKTKD